MPKTMGAKSWSIHDILKVAETLKNKDVVSTEDDMVKSLSRELNRSPKAIQRIVREVRNGQNRLLKTNQGKRMLHKYVDGQRMDTKAASLQERIRNAVDSFSSKEPMVKASDVTRMLEETSRKTSEAIKLAHMWGYNQGIADYRANLFECSPIDKKLTSKVDEDVFTRVAKVLNK